MAIRMIFFFDFLHNNCMLSVLIRIASMSYRKNFVGTQKRVPISHGKRAIGVRATEVRLYLHICLRLMTRSVTDDSTLVLGSIP